MRIGIDYTSALNQRAGIGRFTRELVSALLRIDQANSYTLIKPRRARGSVPPLLLARAKVRTLPLSETWMTRLWQRLRLPVSLEVFAGPLDLFHSPDFLLPPLRRTPAVLTIHDLSYMHYPQYAPKPLVRFLSQTVPRSIERASLVLADSECTKADLVALLGVPEAKVMVVPGGVEARFTPADATAKQAVMRRYGLPAPFILSVGTLEPRKNLGRLIGAYARLRQEEGIPHHLALAGGRGWLYEDLFAQVERLSLGDRVHFLGYVADADLSALLSAASLFVYPSFYEGFGLPILEALACGVPVVCSNASCLSEVAGNAALMVDPLDELALAAAMHQALSDHALRAEMVARGIAQAARFSWEEAAKKTLAVYHKAVAGRSPARA